MAKLFPRQNIYSILFDFINDFLEIHCLKERGRREGSGLRINKTLTYLNVYIIYFFEAYLALFRSNGR